MRFNTMISRRGVVTLVGVLGISLVSGAATAAAKKAPNIEGQWQGTLIATGFDPTPYVLNIADQKKNGKFTGQANFVGFDPVSFAGKIQPNRKVKGSFGGDINGEPIVFAISIKVSRDAQSADGTFKGKNNSGEVVVSGTTTLERVPAKS